MAAARARCCCCATGLLTSRSRCKGHARGITNACARGWPRSAAARSTGDSAKSISGWRMRLRVVQQCKRCGRTVTVWCRSHTELLERAVRAAAGRQSDAASIEEPGRWTALRAFTPAGSKQRAAQSAARSARHLSDAMVSSSSERRRAPQGIVNYPARATGRLWRSDVRPLTCAVTNGPRNLTVGTLKRLLSPRLPPRALA